MSVPDQIASHQLGALLEALGSDAPTPGGGAAAAIAGAAGVAAAEKVLRLTIGKPAHAAHDDEHTARLGRLMRARSMFLVLADEDAEGFAALRALWSLPKDDPRRRAAWDGAVRGAIAPPRATLALCADVARDLEGMVGTTSRLLRADLGVGATLVRAAARAAAWNVRVNIAMLPEPERAPLEAETERVLGAATRSTGAAEEGCA